MNRLNIREIELAGFKGLDVTTEIGRLNLFTGINGSGKTAHLLAPSFAVTGGTSLGRKLDDTFQLAGNGTCKVGLILSDGFAFDRGISKDHRSGELSSYLAVSGREELGLKASDALVGERCGRFAPMFDVGEFLALSPDNRRAFLLDLCARRRGGAAVNAEDIATRAALAFLSLPEELGPGTVDTFVNERFGIRPDLIQTPDMRAKVVETILSEKVAKDRATVIRELLKEVRAEISGEISEAIGSAIEHVRQAANLAKKEQERGTEAAKELSARKAAVQQVAGDIETMRASLVQLEAERSKLQVSIGQSKGRESAETTLNETIARIDREIVSAQTTIRNWEAEVMPTLEEAGRLEAEASGLTAPDRSKLEELNRQRTAMFAEGPSNLQVAELEKKRNAASDAESKASREISQHEGYLAVHRRESAGFEKELESAKLGPWRTAKRLMAALIKDVQPSTPFVQPALELARHIDAQATGETDPESIVAEIAGKHRIIEAEEKVISELRAAHKAAIDQRLAIESELTKARAELAAAAERKSIELRQNAEAIAAEESRLAEFTKHPDGLRAKAKEIRDRHENRKRSIKETNASIATKQVERSGAADSLEKLRKEAGSSSLANLTSELELVETTMRDVKVNIQAKDAYSLLEREYTACVANAEKRGIAHEVAKNFGLAIKAMRESMMADLIAPAKTLIDRFLSAARPGIESYCELENDRGTAIFELGWVRDGRRVALPALSGGERCIFIAALGYALTMLADPPLKLLLLEASEIDLANLTDLMEACEAVADDLGNVLIATHVDNVEAATGWNIVRCEPKTSTVRVCSTADVAEAVA